MMKPIVASLALLGSLTPAGAGPVYWRCGQVEVELKANKKPPSYVVTFDKLPTGNVAFRWYPASRKCEPHLDGCAYLNGRLCQASHGQPNE
jgi:hypothetical protein